MVKSELLSLWRQKLEDDMDIQLIEKIEDLLYEYSDKYDTGNIIHERLFQQLAQAIVDTINEDK